MSGFKDVLRNLDTDRIVKIGVIAQTITNSPTGLLKGEIDDEIKISRYEAERHIHIQEEKENLTQGYSSPSVAGIEEFENYGVIESEESTNLYNELENIFKSASGYVFHDGMDSEFSQGLTEFIHEHGEVSIDYIEKIIEANKFNPDLILETLKYIGMVEDDDTHSKRFDLLISCLDHDVYEIRDGAMIGLESLESKEAIPHIEVAILIEKDLDLKAYMIEVKKYLENL